MWVTHHRRRRSPDVVASVGQSEGDGGEEKFSLAALMDAIHNGTNVENLNSIWLKQNFTELRVLEPLEKPFAPPPPPSAEIMARAQMHCPKDRAGWHGEAGTSP